MDELLDKIIAVKAECERIAQAYPPGVLVLWGKPCDRGRVELWLSDGRRAEIWDRCGGIAQAVKRAWDLADLSDTARMVHLAPLLWACIEAGYAEVTG